MIRRWYTRASQNCKCHYSTVHILDTGEALAASSTRVVLSTSSKVRRSFKYQQCRLPKILGIPTGLAGRILVRPSITSRNSENTRNIFSTTSTTPEKYSVHLDYFPAKDWNDYVTQNIVRKVLNVCQYHLYVSYNILSVYRVDAEYISSTCWRNTGIIQYCE